MAQPKIDYQKINSLKAKVYDKMVLIEQHTFAIQEHQKEVGELSKQIQEEQNKIPKS